MHIRKLVSLLLALALLCAPFALAEESEEPKYGGTLVAYVSADPMNFDPATLTAVSYTHLSGGPGRVIGLLHALNDYEMDIQVACMFWPHFWSRKDLAHLMRDHGLKVGTFIPVSYTHLDVYKRQAAASTATPK